MKDGIDQFKDEAELARGKLPVLERIVYDFVTDCRKALANNEIIKFCNIVELFAASFPYETKDITKKFNDLQAKMQLDQYQNRMTQGIKKDPAIMQLNYAMQKYHILTQLLKAKNLYPKPAEYEEF